MQISSCNTVEMLDRNFCAVRSDRTLRGNADVPYDFLLWCRFDETKGTEANQRIGTHWFKVSLLSMRQLLLVAFLLDAAAAVLHFNVASAQERAMLDEATETKAGQTQANVPGEGNVSDEGDASSNERPQSETELNLPALKDHRSGGPYCGINSLFACLSALDFDIDPEVLISVDYVGSHAGSSVADLVRAAQDIGASATYISHMTSSELRQATTPMILHTRSGPTGKAFDHWVAFLGVEDDRVRISDFPHPFQSYSMAEVLANWDGTAVVLSRQSSNSALLWGARLNGLQCIGLLFGTVYGIRRIVFRDSDSSKSDPPHMVQRRQMSEAGVIVALSLALALGWHAVSLIGFFHNPTALAEVTRRYYSADFPSLTLRQTVEEIDGGNSLVLDARSAEDYRYGSLPRAKSMSIFTSLPERQELLAQVPKSRRIIVYCQSANCLYADEIARFLKFNGFENVAIYRQGYREWRDTYIDNVTRATRSQEVQDAR